MSISKRLVVAILALCIMVSFTACGSKVNHIADAKEAIAAYFERIKAADLTDFRDLDEYNAENANTIEYIITNEPIMKDVLPTLSYEVLTESTNSGRNGQEARIKIKISSIDLRKVIAEAKKIEPDETKVDEFDAAMRTIIADPAAAKSEKNVELFLVKKAGADGELRWFITVAPKFIDSLMCGFELKDINAWVASRR